MVAVTMMVMMTMMIMVLMRIVPVMIGIGCFVGGLTLEVAPAAGGWLDECHTPGQTHGFENHYTLFIGKIVASLPGIRIHLVCRL
jgi:hypothetical protein